MVDEEVRVEVVEERVVVDADDFVSTSFLQGEDDMGACVIAVVVVKTLDEETRTNRCSRHLRSREHAACAEH